MTHTVTRFIAAFAFSSALSLSPALATGDIYALQGMTFEQVQSGTKIVLEGTTGLPYRLINSSDKNITLEIDSVDPEKTISTDFSRSDSIHHVTLKPLSANSLKVSIFGDKLGHPFITFNPNTEQNTSSTEANSAVPPSTQTNAPPEAYALEAFSGLEDPTPITTTSDSNKDAASDSPVTGLERPDRQAFSSNEPVFPESKIQNTEDAPFPENLLLLLGKILVESPTTLLYMVLGTLGLIIGCYSIIKLATLFKKRNAASSHIRNLLNLNTANTRQNPFGHSPFAKGFTGAGLQQHAPLTEQSNSQPVTRQPIPGLNPSANHLIAKTQAEKQYQRANQSVPERKPVDRQKLDTELKRSIEMKYAWGRQNNTAAAPSKWSKSKQNTPQFPTVTQGTQQQAKNSGSMPQENKEVISFLRSVAELMEKDGKPELANEIKRTLS